MVVLGSEAKCKERVTKRRGMKRRKADNAWDEGEETAYKVGCQEQLIKQLIKEDARKQLINEDRRNLAIKEDKRKQLIKEDARKQLINEG
jgi:hypothetical protein